MEQALDLLTGVNGWLTLGVLAGAFTVYVLLKLWRTTRTEPRADRWSGQDTQVVTWGMGHEYEAPPEIQEPEPLPPSEPDAPQGEYSHATPAPIIYTTPQPKKRPRLASKTSRFAQVEVDVLYK